MQLVKNFRHQVRRLARALPQVRQLAKHYSISSIRIAARYHTLRKKGYAFSEARSLGLFDPRPAHDILPGICSHRELRRLQAPFYPGMTPHYVDKAAFYLRCIDKNLTVPRLYAVFERDRNGWCNDGQSPESPDEWCRYIDSLPRSFVIKPALSSHGNGFNVYQRVRGTLIDSEDRATSPEAIVTWMRRNSCFRKFVIQERVRNCTELEELCGTKFLQTARIITVLRQDSSCFIFPTARLIAGANKTDNYDFGRTGNLNATLSLNDGSIQRVYAYKAGSFGKQVISTHPTTGRQLTGFRMPFWKETLTLTERAACQFAEYGAIGWDIAIGQRGPVLIEANPWFDPPAVDEDVEPLLQVLRDDLRPPSVPANL